MASVLPFDLSPELALLAATDLASDASLAAMAAATAQRGLDWQRFGALAAAHAMGPIVAARLAPIIPGGLPASVRAPLQDAQRESAASCLAQTAQSAGVSRILAQAGIRSIVLKGVALSHLLYAPHCEWRRSGDIDLLADPARFLDADKTLRAAGYKRTWPEGDLPVPGLDMLCHLANVFTYLAPGTGQLLELHHRISLNPHWLPASFDALYDASTEIQTAGGPIRGLEGPLHVSYLAWHALGHDGYRLKWFCDIARALRRADAASCTDYLAGNPHQTSLHPLRIVDGVLAAIGLAVNEAPQPGQADHDDRDVQRILAELEQPNPIPTGRSLAALSAEIGTLRFLMRISGSGKARKYQLLRNSCDPRDVYALGLSRGFAPLYAALGPFLAAGRLFTRSMRRARP